MIPKKYGPALFSLILSGLMSLSIPTKTATYYDCKVATCYDIKVAISYNFKSL
jgi:hypothetical protein